MKKLFTTLTMLMFVAMGCMNAQQGTDKYMYTGTFTFNFSDQVKIQIGGAAQTKGSNEWKNGSKVGGHTIDANTFDKLKAATSSQFKVEIETKNIGPLHKVKITDLTSGKTFQGIYDKKFKKITFGKAKGSKAGADSGKTDIGVVEFKLDINTGAVTNGKFTVASVANKGAIVVSIRAIFTFTSNDTKAKN